MDPQAENPGIGVDGLFVYGSLRAGGSRHRWLQRTHPEGLCRAWAPGRLFHLPEEGCAAMVPAFESPDSGPPGSGWVEGEFIGYPEEEDLWRALEDLDPLEGVEEGLFERRIIGVLLDSGHRYIAWVYCFPEDRLPRLEREAVELPGGDWSAYL